MIGWSRLEGAIAELVAAALGVPPVCRKTQVDADGDRLPDPNPYTMRAVLNLARLGPWMAKAAAAIGGRRTSTYRCPAINRAVGGIVGSAHMLGIATDVVPTNPEDLDAAARKLLGLSLDGSLGPLDRIVIERGRTGRGGKGGRLHLQWVESGPGPVVRITEDKRF